MTIGRSPAQDNMGDKAIGKFPSMVSAARVQHSSRALPRPGSMSLAGNSSAQCFHLVIFKAGEEVLNELIQVL